MENSRHSRLVPTLAGFLLGLGLVTFLYSRFIEPRTLLVREFDIAVDSLPPELDGCKLAFMSDFHFGGPGIRSMTVDRAFDEVRRQRPDLILLGGDFFDHGVRSGDEPDWSRLTDVAPVFAVPGNHDYKTSPEAAEYALDTLRTAGITVLRNSSQSVPVRDSYIDLIGVDDPYTYRSDFTAAHEGVKLNNHPRILNAHAGMITEELPIGAADLILTGHTHGAQVRLSPFKRTGPLDVFWWIDQLQGKRVSHYRQGLFWVRGSLLYVGNGIGMTSYGVRFLAPPELAMFTLRRSSGNEEYPCDSPQRYTLRSAQARYWASS